MKQRKQRTKDSNYRSIIIAIITSILLKAVVLIIVLIGVIAVIVQRKFDNFKANAEIFPNFPVG